MRNPLDTPILAAEPIVRRVAAGEWALFPEVMRALWEPCARLVRSSSAMRSSTEDDARDVVTGLMAKLEHDDHRALRLYVDWCTRHPEKDFADWLKITVANAVRDHLRDRRGASDARAPRAPSEPSAKRLLNELAKSLPLAEIGVRPPFTDAQTARQLLDFARAHLPDDQLQALGGWLEGESYEAIAEHRGLLGANEGKRLVRAAVAVLRRRFGAADGDPGL